MMGRFRPHHGEAIMARRRLRAAEWAVLIEEWQQSGLKLPEFCRQRGLSRGTMQGWVYKPALKRAIEAARREGPDKTVKTSRERPPVEPSPSPAFLPVHFAEVSAPTLPPTVRAAIEVVLGGGRRVAVGPGFDEQTLRRVVAVLESRPC
jgi:hypothetical protein